MTTMTIQDELAQLAKLTSREAVHQAEIEDLARNKRGQYRGPVQDFTGTVADITPKTIQDGGYERYVAMFHITDAHVTKARTPVMESSFDLPVRAPSPAATKANPNVELSRMVTSANAVDPSITGILDLLGKQITCEEDYYVYDRWVGETKSTVETIVFYWKVVAVGGVKATVAATASLEGEETACAFAAGKTDSELTPNAFLQGFIQAGGTDAVVQAEIAGRKFLPRMVSEGKLNKLEDGAYALN